MRHGRDLQPLLRADLVDLHHEWHVAGFLEPVGRVLAQHRGRERPEAFAPLDLEIQDVLHIGTARIADDRPIAERARPPFHPTLEPSDDVAACDAFGDPEAERPLFRHILRDAAVRRDLAGLRLDEPGDLGFARGGSEIGMIHHSAASRHDALEAGRAAAAGSVDRF